VEEAENFKGLRDGEETVKRWIMGELHEIRIEEEFKPSPKLVKLYFIYYLLAIIIGFLPWYIPTVILAPPVASIPVSLVFIPMIIFAGVWIPKYYDSIFYKVTEHEIVWRRGVWFKYTGIVPYNRITNIDIAQGPISRRLGIASLKIQTAGYSAGKPRAELRLDGIERFEELRDLIMSFVKKRRPEAVEVFEEEEPAQKILEELVKIRRLLEEYVRK